MKTKLFLTAVGLSALSVACTNEDMLVDKEVAQNADRPVVDVRVNAEFPLESDDVESRKVTGTNGSFLWETKTDQLGAVRVDGSTLYAVGDEHYSNAKFTIVDQSVETSSSASFTTNNTLSIGSYLFYYPYSAAMTTSNAGVKFSLPLVQDYDSDGNKMLDNDFQISPIVDVAGYEEGTLELPIKMRSIYAYGKLNLVLGESTKLNGTGDALTSLEVQKVILRTGSDESFIVSGVISQENLGSVENGRAGAYKGTTEDAIANNMATQFDWIGVETKKPSKYFAAIDTIFAEYKAESYAVSNATNYLTADASDGTSSALSINYLSEGTATGKTLASGKTLSTRFLIPAAKYINEMTLEVYTDKGMFTATLPENLVAKRGYTVNLADPNRTETGYSDATIEIGALTTPSGLVSIVSKNDFLATMKQYSTAAANTEVKVEFLNVKVDEDMVAAIPANVNLIIESDVAFEGNMTLKNIKVDKGKTATFNGNITLGTNFEFTGNTVIAGGTVTLDKTITGAEGKTTTVTAGTLVLPNNTLSYASTINVDGGTLSIGTAPAADNDNLDLKLASLKAGTINVNVPVVLNENVYVGDENDGANTTAVLNVNADIDCGDSWSIGVNKTATVNNNAKLVIETNAGTVVNNKDANLTLATNKGVVTNKAGAVANLETNEETVNNSGTLSVTNNEGTSEAEKAVIEQKAAGAILYLSSNKAYGKIVLCEDSETQVDGNEEYAEIVYIDGALFSLNTTYSGRVSYVVEEWDGTLPHKNINDLTVNSAFTLAADGDTPTAFTVPAQLNAIEFKSTAAFNRPVTINQTITWNGDVTFGCAATIGGTMNFFGNVEVKAASTISENAALVFNGVKGLNGEDLTASSFSLTSNNGRLTINANIAANGSINVTYGNADADNGIAAGSIWNNATVTAENETEINENDAWRGNKAE